MYMHTHMHAHLCAHIYMYVYAPTCIYFSYSIKILSMLMNMYNVAVQSAMYNVHMYMYNVSVYM